MTVVAQCGYSGDELDRRLDDMLTAVGAGQHASGDELHRLVLPGRLPGKPVHRLVRRTRLSPGCFHVLSVRYRRRRGCTASCCVSSGPTGLCVCVYVWVGVCVCAVAGAWPG